MDDIVIKKKASLFGDVPKVKMLHKLSNIVESSGKKYQVTHDQVDTIQVAQSKAIDFTSAATTQFQTFAEDSESEEECIQNLKHTRMDHPPCEDRVEMDITIHNLDQKEQMVQPETLIPPIQEQIYQSYDMDECVDTNHLVIVNDQVEPVDSGVTSEQLAYAAEYTRADDQIEDTTQLSPQVIVHEVVHDEPIGPVLTPLKLDLEFSLDPPPQVVVHSFEEVEHTPAPALVPAETTQYQLFITAVEAKNLTQVQRFGTQTPFLELKIENYGSTVQTFGHKKGGSAATWNQNFTLPFMNRLDKLCIAAKTSNGLIGMTSISITYITENYLDNYFTIFNAKKDIAGEIRLQLRVVDKLVQDASNGEVPSQVRKDVPQVEVDPYIRKGGLLTKYPYHSNSAPKRQWFAVEEGGVKAGVESDGVIIHWSDPADEKHVSGYICLKHVTNIFQGCKTKAFKNYLARNTKKAKLQENICFSIVTNSRSLDVTAPSAAEATRWIDALTAIMFGPDSKKSMESARAMDAFRDAAMTPREESSKTNNQYSKLQTIWMKNMFRYARKNDVLEVSKLLAEGCPIDLMESGSGDTALMIACRKGHTKLVNLCLSWRAKNDPHPTFGETALQAAIISQHFECAQKILETAAVSNMDGEIVNHADTRHDAPHHIAAKNGDIKCLELLVHHGADPSLVDAEGRTPLHCAAWHNEYECAAFLIDIGGDDLLDAGDHHGDTALHRASQIGAIGIVTLLLQSAANATVINLNNQTPYDLAREHNQAEVMEALAEYHDVAERGSAFSRCLKPGENAEDAKLVSPRAVVVSRLSFDDSVGQSRKVLSRRRSNPSPSQAHDAKEDRPQTSREYSTDTEHRTLPRLNSTISVGGVNARNFVREALQSRPQSTTNAAHSKKSGHYFQDDTYYESGNHTNIKPKFGNFTSSASPNVYDENSFYIGHVHWYCYHTNAGDPYYINQVTGVSQWEDPRSTNIICDLGSSRVRSVPLSARDAIRSQSANKFSEEESKHTEVVGPPSPKKRGSNVWTTSIDAKHSVHGNFCIESLTCLIFIYRSNCMYILKYLKVVSVM